MNVKIGNVINWFGRVYLGGIPQLIRDETAFLSFVCMLAGIEALGGYWNPDASGSGANGERFRGFVATYFPEAYRPLADALWDFRNGMIHGFSPRRFALTHHSSSLHFEKTRDGGTILNAEDFYAAFLHAAQGYFAEVVQSPQLQEKFLRCLGGPAGGSFVVGFLDVIDENRT
jgi:hypothetical protein